MLTYPLDSRAGLPIYEYLYKRIKADIVSGKLRAGERLPSKRGLAQHLKISVITVENAYLQLIAEGYVYSEEKRGYFVGDVHPSAPAPHAAPAGFSEPEKKRYFLDISANSVGREHFPFSTWSRLMRDVLSKQDTRLLEPIPYNGIPELRAAIADFLYRFRGISVSPAQIIIGAGTEYMYNLIIQLLGRDGVFAVEDPGYLKISQIYGANAVDCRRVAIDERGVSLPSLRRSGADILHISPSHHYPTGIVTPISRRQELLSWAGEKDGRYIIEDDYDSEFRFSGRPIPTLQSIDTGEKVIYINSFTKTLAPSIRISYMILPPHLTERFRQRLSFYSCTVSCFEQHTLAAFISGGFFESHINRMKKFYRSRRDAVISAIKESPFAKMTEISEKGAGLHFLLRVDTDRTDEDIVRTAADAGVRLAFMSAYSDNPAPRYRHCIVVNYSGIDDARLPEAIDRLAKAFGLS